MDENFVGAAEGVDWFAVYTEYYPKVVGAQSDEEAYRQLAEMVALLGDPVTFLLTPEEMKALPDTEQEPSTFSGSGHDAGPIP